MKGGEATDLELLLEIMLEVAPNPFQRGLTDLLDQTRLVGSALFHLVGVVAVHERRDALVGELLSEHRTTIVPNRGTVPFATAFTPELTRAMKGWPSKQLRDALRGLLVPPIPASGFTRSWEAWTYLYSVANCYFQGAGTPSNSWIVPYLQVNGSHSGNGLVVEAAATAQGRFRKLQDAHPAFQAGLCGGSFELFVEAAATFEDGYTRQANHMDWAAQPSGAYTLPVGPHYPGEGKY